MTRLGRLMLVLLGSLALVTDSWAQPEGVDSKAVPGAIDPNGGVPMQHSYWRRLSAMLAIEANWKLPSNVTPEALVIDSAEGAGGLRFGMTTDDVVARWGLPTGIELRTRYRESELLTLRYGRNHLGFNNNELCRIELADDTIPAAVFSNGIGFESSPEDVLGAFGTPLDEDDESEVFWFDDGETQLRFHFMEHFMTRKPELIVLALIRCGKH